MTVVQTNPKPHSKCPGVMGLLSEDTGISFSHSWNAMLSQTWNCLLVRYAITAMVAVINRAAQHAQQNVVIRMVATPGNVSLILGTPQT